MALGRHYVANVKSTNRHRPVQAIERITTNNTIAGTAARCEMDSHADTCVAGPNFVIIEYTGEHCDVRPYLDEYKPITDVPIVNASTAYTDPKAGVTLILQLNQVLWYGKKMQMNLINPNQIHHGGLVVSDNPTNHDRTFRITGDNFTVPFDLSGTPVYFVSQAPTQWELENCRVVEMTVDSPRNPTEIHICSVGMVPNKMEETTMREICTMQSIPTFKKGKQCDCCDSDLSVYDDAMMITKMIGDVSLATAHQELQVSFVGSKDRHSQIYAETVAKSFRCGI